MSKLEPNVVGQTGRPGLTSLIRIHVANPSDLEELRDALDHAQCPTIQNGDTLLVKDPLPADEAETRLELTFFLKAWRTKRPAAQVELLG
jgi:hypothetical protein